MNVDSNMVVRVAHVLYLEVGILKLLNEAVQHVAIHIKGNAIINIIDKDGGTSVENAFINQRLSETKLVD